MSSTTKRLSFIVALAIGASAACADVASDDESTPTHLTLGQKQDDLYVLSTVIWPSPRINVCWEQAGQYAIEKAWAQDALSRSWEAESAITFVGFGTCSANQAGLHVMFYDALAQTHGMGTQLNGLSNGIQLDTHVRSDNLCMTATGWNRERCVRATAVHEFGHAIGFAHEQNRPDWDGGSCGYGPQGPDGDTYVGSADPNSVMNYCTLSQPIPSFDHDARITGTDVMGVRQFYGSPRPVSAVTRAYPRLDTFGRGSNNQVKWNVGDVSTNVWSGWQDLTGTQIQGAPFAVATGTSSLSVFAITIGGALEVRDITSGSTGTWGSFGFPTGGPLFGSPVAVFRGNVTDVFARNSAGIWTIRRVGVGWGSWFQISTDEAIGDMAAISWDSSRVDLFYRNRADNLLHSIAGLGTSSTWIPNTSIGNTTITMATSPTVASWATNRLDVFFGDATGTLRHKAWTGSSWFDEGLGAAIRGAPTAVSRQANQIDIFVVGTDDQVYQKSWTGSAWTGFILLGSTAWASPALPNYGSFRLDVLVRGTGNSVFQNGLFNDGHPWLGWVNRGGPTL